MSRPFISICVPTYKRADLLKRLFESILTQSFTNFEIVITDNSDDDSVKLLSESFSNRLPIRYHKNIPAVSMGENWNLNISKAQGQWIKMMHDDDWFASPHTLQTFANHTRSNKKFLYSSFFAAYDDGRKELKRFGPQSIFFKLLLRYPEVLFAENIIGPPTVTMIHSSVKEEYDIRLKWRVDIDYYIRVLNQEKEVHFIDEPLINIGISEVQTTQTCLNNPLVELPETKVLLDKFGSSMLRNIIVYDAVWRMMRNMQITTHDQLLQYVNQPWPKIILALVNDISHHPPHKLAKGWYSKAAMLTSWLKNLHLRS